MEVVAVDWSGAARGAAARIFVAHVVDGVLVTLRNGRTRRQVVEDLVELRAHCPAGLVVGLDFSFSFPAWFARSRRCSSVDDVWRTATREGEDWLAECAPPFWGRPGRPRPELAEHLRQAEKAISVGGIGPKSTFQIGGAGAVGTGSVRGMPYLPRLREGGFGIWPFDPAAPWTVLEIYPRLMTGPVRKSDLEQRALYLDACPWSLSRGHATSMIGSEDAFDAGISALVMHDNLGDLTCLRPTTDPRTLLEGDVWRPPKIVP